MKPKTTHLTVILSAVLLMSGVALAQNSSDNTTEANSTLNDTEDIESKLGSGVISYNFVTKGLPAQAAEEAEETGEVEAERDFEIEPDSDTNFSISESEAQDIAVKELGSNEWDLTSSDRSSDGVYEFEFSAGESEAEVDVDGSTGKVTRLEGEVEYEPEESEKRDSAVVSLTGFIQFEDSGYELEVESEEEDSTVTYTVTIEESEEDVSSQQITKRSISEQVDVEEGTYDVDLVVVRDGERVIQQNRKVEVPGTGGVEEEDSQYEESPENMTREELVEEVKDLRERIVELTGDKSDSEDKQGEQGPPEDIPANPGQGEDNEESEEANETEESNETEENETEDSSQGPPSEAPGNSDRRPGFVNNILSGLFG